jgi:hypothetical protein
MRLIYHPDAETELIEAARYYESRVETLGDKFLDAADRAIAIILDAPERWMVQEEDIRRYVMPRFPYAFITAFYPITSESSPSSITVDTRTTGVTVSQIKEAVTLNTRARRRSDRQSRR